MQNQIIFPRKNLLDFLLFNIGLINFTRYMIIFIIIKTLKSLDIFCQILVTTISVSFTYILAIILIQVNKYIVSYIINLYFVIAFANKVHKLDTLTIYQPTTIKL